MDKPTEPVKFTKPEVAEKFEALITDDVLVHKAGVYSGAFSNISLKMAEAMVKQKSNLIKAKEVTPPKADKPEPNKDGKPK